MPQWFRNRSVAFVLPNQKAAQRAPAPETCHEKAHGLKDRITAEIDECRWRVPTSALRPRVKIRQRQVLIGLSDLVLTVRVVNGQAIAIWKPESST